LLDIDVQGAVNFEKKFPHSNFIFICPPSLQHMHDRLVKRGTETEASMKTRMENATKEVDFLLTWREKVNYRIFNDDLELSKTTLLNLLRVLYSTELDVKELQQIAEPVREPAS